MTQIETKIAPLKTDYAELTLKAIAQRPDAIASRQRIAENQKMTPQDRETKLAALMASARASLSRITAGS